MRKLFFLPFCLITAISAIAQNSGRTCIPFDSTFHFLKPRNLNCWVQGGLLMAGQQRHWNFYQSMSLNLHYVPVRYLQTGFVFTKRWPSEQGISFWKSYDLDVFARYSFIRLDCPKVGIYGQAGYTNMVRVQKDNGGKASEWSPYVGMGIYKDLGRSFSIQLENALYFQRRSGELSLDLVWKFANCKF